MIKKQLLLSALVLSAASGTTFGMFKKFTQPAQDVLKHQFATSFSFSDIIPKSVDTLIAYNKNKRNNAIVRLFLAAPVAAVATLLRIDMVEDEFYREKNRHFDDLIIPQTMDRWFASFMCIASFVYTAKKGYTAYTRQWMIHHLKRIKNDNSNKSNFLNKLTVKSYTHQDIKNSISRATVVPSDKKTDTTITLNINNPETLEKVLLNKFNSPENILTRA